VIRYAGHAPDDDVALLVIYRDGALTVRRRRRDSRQRPDSGPGPVAALTTMLDQVIAWSQALAPLRAPAAAL